MLSTNLVLSEWERIFKHSMTAFVAIDRIVHHSMILNMMTVESCPATEAPILQQAQKRRTEATNLI
jgi:DNA replication protein DnaC